MKYFLFLFALTVFVSCSNTHHAASRTVTEADAAQGIREMLDEGVRRGVALLSKTDGFSSQPAYRLGLPDEARTIESSLRQIGMGSLVDKVMMQVNRAAEDAVVGARPLFTQAIHDLSFTDALGLVQGAQDAATSYLKQRSETQIRAAFAPIVKSSLDKFNAMKFFNDMIGTYNGFPSTSTKLNPDLAAYVTNKTINSLFDQIAREEADVRTRASARSTPMMKRVFRNRQ